jgi:hypothetical protein
MKTIKRLLGLVPGMLKIMFLLAKLIIAIQQIVDGATNYHARYLFS